MYTIGIEFFGLLNFEVLVLDIIIFRFSGYLNFDHLKFDVEFRTKEFDIFRTFVYFKKDRRKILPF